MQDEMKDNIANNDTSHDQEKIEKASESGNTRRQILRAGMIAAPLVVDLVNGQIIDIVIVDTADPAVVELLVLESVLP